MHFRFEEIINPDTKLVQYTITHQWEAPEGESLYYALSPRLAERLGINWDDLTELPTDAAPQATFYAAVHTLETPVEEIDQFILVKNGLDLADDLFITAPLEDAHVMENPAVEVGPFLYDMYAAAVYEGKHKYALDEEALGTLPDEWWGLYRFPSDLLASWDANEDDIIHGLVTRDI